MKVFFYIIRKIRILFLSKVLILSSLFVLLAIVNQLILETMNRASSVTKAVDKVQYDYTLFLANQSILSDADEQDVESALEEIKLIDNVNFYYYELVDNYLMVDEDFYNYLSLENEGETRQYNCAYKGKNSENTNSSIYYNEFVIPICGVINSKDIFLPNIEKVNTDDLYVIVIDHVLYKGKDKHRALSEMRFIVKPTIDFKDRKESYEFSKGIQNEVKEILDTYKIDATSLILMDNSSLLLSMKQYVNEYWQRTWLESISLISFILTTILIFALYEKRKLKRVWSIMMSLGISKINIWLKLMSIDLVTILLSMISANRILQYMHIRVLFLQSVMVFSIILIVYIVTHGVSLFRVQAKEIIPILNERRE